MAEERVKRKLAAIVSADVVGWSRLMGEDEAGTLATFKCHRQELIDPKIAEYGGRIVKTTGDGLLVEFSSAVDAVRCSVEIQDAMVTRNADLPDDKQMLFRVGINLGDVIIDGDDVFGEGVNVAARLEALAQPGGISISGSVHDQVSGRLPSTFADGGTQTVKNIAKPIHVWTWPAASTEPGESRVVDLGSPVDVLQGRPAIAVVPFDNMSGDPEQEYFVDGITEDIITALAAWRWFQVIARHSTFAYKGASKTVPAIARELGVRYVVEGSVRRVGQRVRITAQLIDAVSDRHLWARRYDRELDDIFAIQDEITGSIATSIEPELSRAERSRVLRKRPENLDAWELTLRAQMYAFQFTKEDNAKAKRLLLDALKLDPISAYANSMLALCHYKDAILGFSDDRGASLDDSAEFARAAAEFDSADWLAHAVRGIAVMWKDRDFERALEHVERAVSLNQSSTWARAFLSCILEFGGSPGRAVDELNMALRLDPHSPFATFLHADLAISYFLLRDYENAARSARQALQLSPGNVRARQRLLASLGHLGAAQEAKAELDKLLRRQPDFSSDYIDQTYPFRFAEDRAHFLDGLRKAGWES